MSIVAGVDFGSLSVCASILDRVRRALGHASADYPLLRSKTDPDFATQRHEDQMEAPVRATRDAIAKSGVDGSEVRAPALDTTGSSVAIVGKDLVPLADYYLWCDHRAFVNPALGGVTFGCTLTHTAGDEFFAAIEGTAMNTRIILERMESKGTKIRRVSNGGGIPKRDSTLNQVYANILNKPVLVATGDVTSLGSVIFAFLAAGDFKTVEEAQNALCLPFITFTPQETEVARAEQLFHQFRTAYFALGSIDAEATSLGHILPTLRTLRQNATAV